MTTKSLEERVEHLEKVYEKRIQRLEDMLEIQNLMGRYVYYHEVHRETEFPELFYARNAPDISGEVADMGCYSGQEAVIKLLKTPPPAEMHNTKGMMIQHTLTTPVIEVAGDGKTAKGIWISPGHETGPDRATGQCKGHWAWCKYGCDFIKEDGQWRLWHYHIYAVFTAPYDKDWVDTPQPGTPEALDASIF